uniref:replication protein RepA n=1 Tax=Corynebacterium mastitidis TaxID=161890 RepID=UPI00035EE43A
PASKIVTDPASDAEVGYTTRVFVQALFPYKSSTELVHQIQQGPVKVTVVASDGLPYGKYPRLIMAYVVTQAVARAGMAQRGELSQEEARRIPFGNSLNEFLRAIGLTTRGGGKVIENIRMQVDRLAACSIKVENVAKTALSTQREAKPTMDISHRHELWLTHNPDHGALHDSFLELTEEFFSELVAHPIPVDLNVLNRLGRPRAMDIYTWLALKKYWLSHQTKKLASYTFDWDVMENHFSPKTLTTWVEHRDLRNEMKKCLEAIEELWPQMGAEVTKEGVVIYQGPTPVQPTPRNPALEP